jgi:prepilin-type N-terminal cleavage/methylation domain-containing protein
MTDDARDDSGFSLLELVIVAALLAVTLAAAWTVMTAVSLMSNKMSARATATDESQTFVNNIEDELLQANSLKSIAGTSTANADAQAAFYDVQPREIGFYADINRDGKPERIAYYVNGASLIRQQTSATGMTYPFSWATSSAPLPVIQTIDPSWTGAIFSYYSTGGWPPPPITSVSQAASITIVTVQVRNVATWADQTISYAASSTIRVRAIGNGF